VRLIALATQGDAAALAALESRPESKRRASEWAAIGAGRIFAKLYPEAVQAYEKAFALDPKGAATPQAVADLYQAALIPNSTDASLNVALTFLGARGADMVYAVYEAIANGRAPKLDKKKVRKLFDAEPVKQNASDALRSLLELEGAKSCQDYKRALIQAKSSVDERSLRILRKLTYDRGCGFLNLGDCYSCLRGSRALTDAIETAKLNPAPQF
jgi:hypothetical protein